MKKYEFTKETKEYKGIILHRIKAIKDFGNVKAGDLGGWIEKEDNLSHEGNSWVYENAKVYGNAVIEENAEILENAEIIARKGEEIEISDDVKIYGNIKVYGDSCISGKIKLFS